MQMWTCRRFARRFAACSGFIFSFFLSQIQLKADDLYDKEKVDLETIEVSDVFQLLQCTMEGLAQEEADQRLEIFGPNKLESQEQNPFLQVS